MTESYRPRTTPMRHQLDYLERLEKRPAEPTEEDVMAVLAEMGTGKTAMILYEWQEAVRQGELDDLMVIAPAGSYRNWFDSKSDETRSELETHLDPRLYAELTVGAWNTGGAAGRRQMERMLLTNEGPRAFFMNVEALSSAEGAAEAAVDFLSRGRAMLAIDESTKIKSAGAERTRVVIKSLKPLAKVRRIMTGWVAPKSPLDLYWQFYFLDWRILGYETPAGFKNRYANTERRCFLPNEVIRAKLRSCCGFRKGDNLLPEPHLRTKLKTIRQHLEEDYSQVDAMRREVLLRKLREETEILYRDDMLELIPKLGGYIQVVEKIKSFKNLEELNKKIAPYSINVLKKDCLDLKKKVYSPRDVELTREQKRVYEEMKQYSISQINEEGETVSATSVVTQMIRLHQVVCGHAVTEDNEIRNIDSNRVAEIMEVLEEHQGKAIVWATYQHEIRKIANAIKEVYGPRSCALFYGGNRKGRVEDEKRFLSNPECRFMVSTQSAGGIGNNWAVADLVIYAANSYDLELRVQSEDRAHRKGQRKSVTYVDLIARGTVEERIIHALRNKINLHTAITGENFREWLI